MWGDRFVSESALTSRIRDARRVLEDDGGKPAVHQNGAWSRLQVVADVVEGPQAAASTSPVRPPSYGRDADLERLAHRLGEERLISIVGPGGIARRISWTG